MFSSPSYAEWTKVIKRPNGKTFYVDFERIRKVNGSLYYWVLVDFLKPNNHGHLSLKTYHQGDCKLYRIKYLSYIYHKQRMGLDTGITDNPKNPQWDYPPPNSVSEYITKSVCVWGKIKISP
tara:strand:+ start:236 stop:601 length:366 start_codon:yes stop_codon:yes gene_type:complete